MPTINLDRMSEDDLKKLREDVDKALAGAADRQRKAALAAVEVKAKEFGYSLSDLAGGTAGKKKPAQAPKYSHPENPQVTWSARRGQPGWFKEALAAGKDISAFEIGK